MGWEYDYIRSNSRGDKDDYLRSQIEKDSTNPDLLNITVLKSAFVGKM